MSDAFIRPKTSGLWRNAGQLGGAKVLNRGLGFFWTVVIARTLGVAGFGEYTYLIALVTLTSAFAEGGFTAIVSRDVATDAAMLETMVPTAMGLTIVFNIAAMGVTLAIAWLDTPSTSRLLGAAVIALYLPLNGAFNVISAVFRGRDRFHYDSAFNVIQFLIFALLSGIALWLGWGVLGVLAAYVVRQLITLIATAILCERRIGPVRVAWDRKARRYLLTEGLPLMLSTAAAQVYIRIDIIVLSFFAGTSAVGIYSIASRFIDTLTTGASALGFAALPFLANTIRDAPGQVRAITRRAARQVLGISVVGAAVGVLISPFMIRRLYGVPFAASGHVLQLLLVTVPLYAVSQVLATLLIAEGRQRTLVAVYGGATALSILLNVLFAPMMSYYGSAVAAIGTAGAVGVALWVTAHREEQGGIRYV